MNGMVEMVRDTQEADQAGRGITEFTYKSGDRPLEGYVIRRGLGWGGFGEVYFAVSDGGKEVALKLVQRYLDVELRGVTHCLNLKHPNLLAVFDIRQTPRGENWIVMEYIAGQCLRSELDQAPQGVGIQETLVWMRGIGDAIDYLHGNGIVHRDLKPGNVFRENKLIKVGDYGLSKFISQSRRSGQTQSVGTVHYMAPEISTGNYGPSVDVYSSAVIAFEMLSGDVPFDGESAGEILMKHLTGAPALEKVDRRYHSVFAKALAKDPKDRFTRVGELVDALELVGIGRVSAPKPVEPPKPAPTVEKLVPRQLATTAFEQSIAPPAGTFKARRRAVSDTFWSMFLAGVLSTVLPILPLAADQLVNRRTPDLFQYLTLSIVTGFASWGILLLGRYWESRRVDTPTRRLGGFLWGLVVGVVALVLNIWLGQQVSAQLNQVRWIDFTDSTFQTMLLEYLTTFGLAFAIPDWGNCASSLRPSRFSVLRALVPGSIAVVAAGIVGQPAEPIWVGGILLLTAFIVQWVSPFQPSRPSLRSA